MRPTFPEWKKKLQTISEAEVNAGWTRTIDQLALVPLLNSLTNPVAKEKIEWKFIGFGFISLFLFSILRVRNEAHFDMTCSCELWLRVVTPIAKKNIGRSWQSNGSKNEQHIQFYAFSHKRGARAKTTSFHRVLKSKMNSTQFNEHEHTRPLVARTRYSIPLFSITVGKHPTQKLLPKKMQLIFIADNSIENSRRAKRLG